MCKENIIHFGELAAGARRELPHGGFMEKRIFKDRYGSSINILRISNGLLTFTAIPERGMDMGEIFLGEEKITWDRGEEYLLHPDNVNLGENGGWEKGFYAAVAALGPEIFRHSRRSQDGARDRLLFKDNIGIHKYFMGRGTDLPERYCSHKGLPGRTCL